MKKKKIPTPSKTLFSLFTKITAVFVTFISLTAATAQTKDVSILKDEYYRPVINSPEIKMPEEVTISGFVKDENNNPLINAKINTATGVDAFTDDKGGFSFKMKHEQVAAQSIFFSNDSLQSAVRSYHPVMADAVFDIVLYKPKHCCITIIKKQEIKNRTLHFQKNKSDLSLATKATLDSIANNIKETPSTTLLLTANTTNRKSLQKLAVKRLEAALNYLIEQKGISGDRLKTNTSTEKTDTNSIDIIQQ
jgi:outer membrane protein OmpA-like peptidoglycan-associated protein